MKCEFVQRRLLALEDPAQVPAEYRAHLARCGICRDWQSQLLLLEGNIPCVPVPPSRGKARLLRRLIEMTRDKETRVEKAVPTTLMKVPAVPAVSQAPTLPLSHVLILPRRAAALAAAVLLFVLGWWIFHSRTTGPELPPTKPVADPLLASLVERDMRLATAASPRERIEILADMAQELQDATRFLAQAAASDELDGLARLYEQVVHEGILRQASALPAGERRPILNPIADRLSKTARSVERLVPRVPAECGKPLHAIAEAARQGNLRLYGLLSEARS
jgi:hypothetical protein